MFSLFSEIVLIVKSICIWILKEIFEGLIDKTEFASLNFNSASFFKFLTFGK
jgi:hypothetical protein